MASSVSEGERVRLFTLSLPESFQFFSVGACSHWLVLLDGSTGDVFASGLSWSPMSDMGQSRRFVDVHVTSAAPLKANIHRRSRHVSNVPTGDSSTAVSVIVAGLTGQGRNWPRHGKKQTTRKYDE